MFKFEPAPWIPYRDKEVLERVRNIKRADIEKHKNPDFKIKVMSNPGGVMHGDVIMRMKESDDLNKKLVMLMPNPCPVDYETITEIINRFNINCRNVHTFALDEWADQDGNVAPLSYKEGFQNSFMKYFWEGIREDLRMPIEQCVGPTTETIKDYSKMIVEAGEGGADVAYTGPGWAGHVAFVDPDTPEFGTDSMEEYMEMDARIVTLHPLTIAQNSLHGCFGQSGDIANVPPRAASIGPKDIVNTRNRFEIHGITTQGTFSSWQRMISRLTLHAPPTPQLPTSFLQLLPTSVYLSEQIAADIEFMEKVAY